MSSTCALRPIRPLRRHRPDDMKIAARKSVNGAMARREQLVSERARSATLRILFPEVGQLRLELAFNDPSKGSTQPSPQLHTLYAAAPAFFRFACPCADCDGDFDLTESVNKLIASAPGHRRVASLNGTLSCRGTRFRDHATLETPCPMQLTFRLSSEPQKTE
jgi:hypothetical protein